MITISRQTSAILTAAIVLVVLGLGAWMWSLQPERATIWALSTFFLPAAWTGVLIYRRSGRGNDRVEASAMQLERGIMGAGFILAASLGALVAASLGLIDGTAKERIMGAVLGGFLMVTGNAIPKTVSSPPGCEGSGGQSIRRFAGWTFVIVGLAYTVTWLTLPVEPAATVSTVICAAGVILVLIRVIPPILRLIKVHGQR